MYQEIDPPAAKAQLDAGGVVYLDVRSQREFAEGHVPGALNIPILDFDAAGDLWLATREGNQVFRFDRKAGVIHHIAGNGKAGFTGHGGPAREATLSGPKGIAIDRDGNVWLADTESHTVRMIDVRRGTIEWIAGTGVKGNGGDGDARGCALARLHGIFADSDGAIYVGDSEAHRVRVLRRAEMGPR